ncbi:MAG: hypothetical protein PHS61_01255 [Candidatus Omnitrophica bacterium]|nr:hypothetical protein [Candidatus Omnitrophota bacterium]
MIVWLVVGAFLTLDMAPVAWAQSTAVGPSGTASATVDSFLEFAMDDVVKMSVANGDTDPWNDGTVLTTPSFDFGKLTPEFNTGGDFLYMRGEFFYYVLMVVVSSGRRYKITETGSQLTGPGGATLPREAVLLVPDYQWLDEMGTASQGAPPTGAQVGPVTSACNTDSLVYQSDTNGASRIVRAVVAISGPAAGANYPFNYSNGYNGNVGQGSKQEYTSWKPVGRDQVAGDYTGTITFTAVLN